MFGPTLALGRIVHYVMQASDFGPSSVYLAKAQAKGQAAVMSIVRPAVIVETWGNDKQSDETKAKRSARFAGIPLSLEHRAKLSAAHMGKRLSPSHVERIAASNRGKKRTPEQIANVVAGRLRAKTAMTR